MSRQPITLSGEQMSRQLARTPLFSALGAAELARVEAGCRVYELPRNTLLFHRGDEPDGIHCVLAGQVKLAFSSAQGNEKIVEVIEPGQTFGEAVLFLERPYPVFAEALVDSVILTVARATVLALIDEEPGFARRLLAGLSIRLHALVRDVETYSLRSSTQRVINYLLQEAPQGARTPADYRLELPMAKQVLASRLNLSPETLSRIFNELIHADLIHVAGKRVVLRDPARLAAYEG